MSLIEIRQNGLNTRVACTACGWSSTRGDRIIAAFDHTLYEHGSRENMSDLTQRNTDAHWQPPTA